MILKFSKYLVLIAFALLLVRYLFLLKNNEALFYSFYTDAESKFSDCIKLGLTAQKQPFLKSQNCENLIKPQINKQFTENGINGDSKILSAELSLINDSCFYSKKFVGHDDKPLFATTIYDTLSKIDTAIILNQDTLYYSVTIKKIMVVFECHSKDFKAYMDTQIPSSIKIGRVNAIDFYNRTKTKALLERVKNDLNN